jgi:hypothetical protein
MIDILTTTMAIPLTVAVKKTLPFPLPFVPFVRLQNGAGTDCKRK